MTKHYHRRHSNSVLVPENEAPRAPMRVVRSSHAGLAFSSAMLLVRLMDEVEVAGCDHCADLHYAIVAFIKGLQERPADVLYDVEVGDNMERHLIAGVPG